MHSVKDSHSALLLGVPQYNSGQVSSQVNNFGHLLHRASTATRDHTEQCRAITVWGDIQLIAWGNFGVKKVEAPLKNPKKCPSACFAPDK